MAARKAAPKPPKARTTKKAVPGPAQQLKELRATVRELRAKLAKESQRRKLDFRLLDEAKKARARVTHELGALREQGRHLAAELKKAVVDAKSRERARAEATKLVGELRAQLATRTAELKRKSAELAKLAKESTAQARAIIQGDYESEGGTPAEAQFNQPVEVIEVETIDVEIPRRDDDDESESG